MVALVFTSWKPNKDTSCEQFILLKHFPLLWQNQRCRDTHLKTQHVFCPFERVPRIWCWIEALFGLLDCGWIFRWVWAASSHIQLHKIDVKMFSFLKYLMFTAAQFEKTFMSVQWKSGKLHSFAHNGDVTPTQQNNFKSGSQQKEYI